MAMDKTQKKIAGIATIGVGTWFISRTIIDMIAPYVLQPVNMIIIGFGLIFLGTRWGLGK